MTVYAPQLELPIEAHAPEEWGGGQHVHLPLDHVITRDANGNSLSLVGDLQWDFTYYHPKRKTTRLVFWYWRNTVRNVQQNEITPERVARIREIQYLLFLRIYRAERPVGVVQLVNLYQLLRHLAAFAEEQGCAVRDVLERAEVLDRYIAKVPTPKSPNLQNWIVFLRGLEPVTELGFEMAKPRQWNTLLQRASDYITSQKQHEPLPTRIYMHLINGLSSELSEVESHIGTIQKALEETDELHRQYRAKGWNMGSDFGPTLIEKYGLGVLLSRYGCEPSTTGLTSLLAHWQRIAKTQIHVFSGMRHQEAQYLPYHCIQLEKTAHGRKHAWIVGSTTKLAGGRNKRTRWVTTEEQGLRAVRVAQQIADLIYQVLGVTPSSNDSEKDKFPLFVGTAYLPWRNTLESDNGEYKPGQNLDLGKLSAPVQERLFATIESEDIDELEAIDPFRDWGTDPEFEVGQRWNLKSHQLRRSLALYANASGLVKSSSLRRQLQHITSEMSYYYGRGSVFAKNFLKEDPKGFKKHISVEWPDSEHEAQYLAFTRDVLNSDEPLWGPAGIFYDRKKEHGEVMSAKEVKDQLKSGRMAYKAHPLGGCTHVGTCNKQKGMRLTSGICVSQACKSLIGKHSQIIKLIPIQRGIVARLDPDSIVYAMEKEELNILEAAEVQWRQTGIREGWAQLAIEAVTSGKDRLLVGEFGDV